MTKKDYQKFAEMFSNLKPRLNEDEHISVVGRSVFRAKRDMWCIHVQKAASLFEQDNPRFNRQRFYEACGYNGE